MINYFIPVAHAYNFIDVGSTTASSTLTIAGQLFSDFGIYIYIILGVLLAGTLIGMIVAAFHRH